MIGRIKTLAAATLVAAAFAGPAMAAGEGVENQAQDWSFGGIFGAFDRAELLRGFQVYQDVCSTCHCLQHFAYHNLGDLGYTDDENKAIATWKSDVAGKQLIVSQRH